VTTLCEFKKLLSVARESTGPKTLGHGDLMRDAPLLHVSRISVRREIDLL
jgi:hypothetical protein